MYKIRDQDGRITRCEHVIGTQLNALPMSTKSRHTQTHGGKSRKKSKFDSQIDHTYKHGINRHLVVIIFLLVPGPSTHIRGAGNGKMCPRVLDYVVKHGILREADNKERVPLGRLPGTSSTCWRRIQLTNCLKQTVAPFRAGHDQSTSIFSVATKDGCLKNWQNCGN
jgi:hypothetical protein